MRRPLLAASLGIIILLALLYYSGASPGEKVPADGQSMTVAGYVYRKDEKTILLEWISFEDSVFSYDSDNLSASDWYSFDLYSSDLYSSHMSVSDIGAGDASAYGITVSDIGAFDRKELDKNRFHPSAKYLLCDVEEPERFLLGSKVILQGEFDRFEPATNEGEFDYAAYYRSCGYVGRLRRVTVLAESEEYSVIGEALYHLRLSGEKRLYEVFPEKEASVMSAILLGNKAGVDPELKELYRENGMIHILSISGLHITILGMGVYKLLRRMGAPMWVAAVLGAVLLFLYGAMTGFGISVCRAVGMYLFRMLAVLLGRTYDMPTALGAVAAVLVWREPAYLENMGFLLSFGSVLGIGVLFPVLRPWEEEQRENEKRLSESLFGNSLDSLTDKVVRRLGIFGKGKERNHLKIVHGTWGKTWQEKWDKKRNQGWRKSVCEGLLAGFSVTWTTLPIQLWFSYEIPVYSVLLNVCVLPFMSVVLVAGILSLFPGLGWCGLADVWILSGYEKLCNWFAGLPFHTWNPGRPAVWQMVFFYALWIVLVWWGGVWHRQLKRAEGRNKRKTGAAGSAERISEEEENARRKMIRVGKLRFCIPLLSLLILLVPKPHGDRIAFLDVGQGDCICMQLSSGEVYLFDCGSSNRKHVGEKVLIPYLKYHGIHEIDAVFLSHADSDHTNGIVELLQKSVEERIRIDQIVLPDIEDAVLISEFKEVLSAVEEFGQDSGREILLKKIRAGDAWSCGSAGKQKVKSGAVENAQEVERKIAIEKIGKTEGFEEKKGKDEGSFLCLHPIDSSSHNRQGGGNAGSECFWIQLKGEKAELSILLTGDTEGDGEKELLSELQKRELGAVTILKVAHHGSKYSTSDELLAQVSPRLAIISCGRKNVYGHPHRETLDRLENIGATVIRTDQNGQITVSLKGSSIRIEKFIK